MYLFKNVHKFNLNQPTTMWAAYKATQSLCVVTHCHFKCNKTNKSFIHFKYNKALSLNNFDYMKGD